MNTVIPISAVNFKGAFDKVARLYFFGVRLTSYRFPDRYAVICTPDLTEEDKTKYPTEEEYLGVITQQAQRIATMKYFANGPEDISGASLVSMAEIMAMHFQYTALLYDSKYIHPGRN